MVQAADLEFFGQKVLKRTFQRSTKRYPKTFVKESRGVPLKFKLSTVKLHSWTSCTLKLHFYREIRCNLTSVIHFLIASKMNQSLKI